MFPISLSGTVSEYDLIWNFLQQCISVSKINSVSDESSKKPMSNIILLEASVLICVCTKSDGLNQHILPSQREISVSWGIMNVVLCAQI